MFHSNQWLLHFRAWAVHFYTSLGLVTAFFSLAAIFSHDARTFFIFQGISLFIDATDGFFARRWNVKVWASGFDGRKLDDIIDFINYSFLPVIFADKFGLIGGSWILVLLFVLISSIYGFCQTGAKTTDGYFTGFPNFWNILVFYLYFFNLPVPVNAFLMLLFSAFIFVPLKFVSFSSPVMRRSSYALNFIYLLFLAIIIVNINHLDIRLVWISLLGPLCYLASALYLHFSGRIPHKNL